MQNQGVLPLSVASRKRIRKAVATLTGAEDGGEEGKTRSGIRRRLAVVARRHMTVACGLLDFNSWWLRVRGVEIGRAVQRSAHQAEGDEQKRSCRLSQVAPWRSARGDMSMPMGLSQPTYKFIRS
jgi:hypothetical protein